VRRFALLAAGYLVLAAPAQAPSYYHLAGEYGLWVTERGGDLHVGWLTETPTKGVLEVIRDGKQLHRFETPVSEGHEVDFPRPPDGPLVLRYGAVDSAQAAKRYNTTVYLTRKVAPAPGVLNGVDSLFVVGDTHGEYDNLSRLLEGAGLIDENGRWSGGHKHVVFLGDLFDRGPDVTRNLWFMYRLEREAARAGGGAHVVLGNHEMMVFTNDLRYTSPKERLVAMLHGTSYPKLFDIRHSVLGRWLRSKPGMMKIDGILLAHGGVTPQYARYGVRAFNDSLRAFLGEDFFYYMSALFDHADTTVKLVQDSADVSRVSASHVVVMDTVTADRRLDFFFADTSVFWFRGYLSVDLASREAGASAASPENSARAAPESDRDVRKAELESVLKRTRASIQVIGHTPGPTVRWRFGGRLIAVDLDHPATEMALLVRDGKGGYRAYRYTQKGPAGPLPEDPADGGGNDGRSADGGS